MNDKMYEQQNSNARREFWFIHTKLERRCLRALTSNVAALRPKKDIEFETHRLLIVTRKPVNHFMLLPDLGPGKGPGS